MAAKTKDSNTSKGLQTFAFEGSPEKFSAFQPIEVKARTGIDWILNGVNNINFRTYRDAYDDSPSNSSIINDFVAYIYGEGLIDSVTGGNLKQIISNEDAYLICQELYIYGGASIQIIWDEKTKKPILIKHIPVYKLGVRYDYNTADVKGYWYCYDWLNRYKYPPKFYPLFTGTYKKEQNVEVLLIRLPTPEPFFPVPTYLSGIPWARVEGELGNTAINHFKNGLQDITVINYNQGRQESPEAARVEADKVRAMATGSQNASGVMVSFNDSIDEAVTVDRISPPELNQQNVFYAEEAERKIQIAHGMPSILFSNSQTGSGFSNNAEEYSMALKILYRKKINPMREILTSGLKKVIDLINPKIMPWFKDFEAEDTLDNTENQKLITVENNGVSLDEETLKAQANLKGSVGGVQALLEIQASYAQGLTTYESAINMLDIIYGYNREQAVRLLGQPKKETSIL